MWDSLTALPFIISMVLLADDDHTLGFKILREEKFPLWLDYLIVAIAQVFAKIISCFMLHSWMR